MLVVLHLAILLLKKKLKQNMDQKIQSYKRFHVSNRFKTKPLRRGQPLYKEQMASPQSVLCLEVLL